MRRKSRCVAKLGAASCLASHLVEDSDDETKLHRVANTGSKMGKNENMRREHDPKTVQDKAEGPPPCYNANLNSGKCAGHI